MSQPVSTPLTTVERKIHIRLAKRSLAASSEENVLKINPFQGRVGRLYLGAKFNL